MSKVLVTESYLEDIADAIREKSGTQNTYKPHQMAAAIEAIDVTPPTQTKNATPSLFAQDIEPDTGYLLSKVVVAAIPYSTSLNAAGGYTVTIAGT